MTSNIQHELDKIGDAIRQCRKCRLCESRKNAVPGDGPADSKIIFIGEAPGRNEDLKGLPFVGLSGEFLNGLLKEANIRREEVFITSSVKCRPPKNRQPKPDELQICKINWLDRQISLINPKLTVLLGGIALKQVLGLKGNLTQFHGKTYEKDGRNFFVTFHPASAMRFPKTRTLVKSDFRKMQEIIERFEPGSPPRDPGS